MKRIGRSVGTLSIAGLLAWAGALPAMAQSATPEAPLADDYAAGDFGRVTYQENGVAIRRGLDSARPATESATANAPVFPGDTLITTADQRAEVQLADGTLVRADRASELTFLALPDPYADFHDNSVLQLAQGAVRIAVQLADSGEFRIDTEAASIYFLSDGDFRVEVDAVGRTDVLSRRGVAEVVGDGGSILVRAGMRTEVLPGSLPQDAVAFNTLSADDFDRWVDHRDSIYLAEDRYEPAPAESQQVYESVPTEVQPYYRELSYYGNWVWDPDYGYVWSPTTVPVGWRPYYDGYWSYGPGGYFWVSNEPWGWAPYHYGRWNWCAGYGWCWAPGSVFGGAWVAWSWGSVYVGWAPLNYWGYPCYGSVYRYYDPCAWTAVRYDHFSRGDYPRYAVPIDQTGDDLRQRTAVDRAPRIPPTELARSPESRTAAERVARESRSAAMRPTETATRSGPTFRDQERQFSRDRVNAGAPGQRSSPQALQPSAGGARQAGTHGRSERGQFPGYPRRIVTDPPSSAGRRQALGATRPSTVRPRDGRTSQTEERVRDLYRRMANPRTAPSERGAVQPRREDPKGRESGSSAGARQGSRPAPSARGNAGQPSSGARQGGERGARPSQQAPRAQPRERRDPQRAPGVNVGTASAPTGSRPGAGRPPARVQGSSRSTSPPAARPSRPTSPPSARQSRSPARGQPPTQQAPRGSSRPSAPRAQSRPQASRPPRASGPSRAPARSSSAGRSAPRPSSGRGGQKRGGGH